VPSVYLLLNKMSAPPVYSLC